MPPPISGGRDLNRWWIEHRYYEGAVKIVSGTSYTFLETDHGKNVLFTASGFVSGVLNSGLSLQWHCNVYNYPTSLGDIVTLTDPSQTVKVLPGQGTSVWSPGGAPFAYQPGSTSFGLIDKGDANGSITLADSGRTLSWNPTSADRTATLDTAASLSRSWSAFVENRGVKSLIVSAAAGVAIDGLVAPLVILPGSGIQFNTDGTNFFTSRGRKSTDINVQSGTSYTLQPSDHYGMVALAASGPVDVYESGVPLGFRTQIRNIGNTQASLVRFNRNGGGVEYIPPFQSYELHVPDSAHSGYSNYAATGATLFGSRLLSGNGSILFSDQGRNVVKGASGDFTFLLPQLTSQTQIFAFAARNLADGGLTLQPSASGQRIDGQLSGFQMVKCQGVWVMANPDNNYYTVTGAPCGVASGVITSGMIGPGAVISGNIASGIITPFIFASGYMPNVSGTGGSSSLTSGQVTSGYLGNGSVVSGSIRSGLFPTQMWAGYDELSSIVYSYNAISGTTFLASGVFSPNGVWQAPGGTAGYSITLPPAANWGFNFIGFRVDRNMAGSATVQTTSGQVLVSPRGINESRVYGAGEVVVFMNPDGSLAQVKHETMRECGFLAYRSGSQSIAAGAPTRVVFDQVISGANGVGWNMNGSFTTLSGTWVPDSPGTYRVGAILGLQAVDGGSYGSLNLVNSGGTIRTLMRIVQGGGSPAEMVLCGETEIMMNGLTDYVAIDFQTNYGPGVATGTTAATAAFWASRVRRDIS